MINRLAELDSSIETIAKSKKPKAKSPVIPLRREKPMKPLAKPAQSKVVAKALAKKYQYDVPGIVPMVAQPKSMACWATVVTMLTSWRDNMSMSVEDTMRQLGAKWLKIYRDNTGLFPSQEQSLFNDVGLAAEAPQSLSVDGWLNLLQTYGPLWVTTDERPGQPGGFHARVITGLHGDGTAKGTRFNIIDPAGGRQYKETIADFLPKYEAEIRETGRTRFQVIHWAEPTAPSQQATSQSLSMRRNKWPTRSAQSYQLALTVNYTVPGIVPVLAQPTSMGCWATVFTMLLSWKRDQSISIENALDTIGDKWVNMYKANTGISSADKSDFISEANLVAEPFHNPSIEGWENMLRNFGPIWVTTDEAPNKPWGIHARIITAINGDGTPDGTSFTIIDPAGGRQYQETISKFWPKYEAEIIERGEDFNRVQIIHWPKDAKYGKAKSFGRITSEQSYESSAMSSSYQPSYAYATDDLKPGEKVPNKKEVEAVGKLKKKIKRDTPEFKALVENNNSDIVFKDEEKTGADRMMTPKLKECCDNLAKLVKDEWPGVKLRVTEAWDENDEHTTGSLHYGARSVDLTTSDKKGDKLGRLGRLAVQAGFGWVLYEDNHIHASVPDTAPAKAKSLSSEPSLVYPFEETGFKLGKGSLKELEGVHPDLVAVVKRAIQITSQDFTVADGMRTVEEQKKYVKSGTSKTMKSRHLTGHAVDLVPYINGKLRWEWEPIYVIADAVRTAAKELGTPIRWGGAWDITFTDTDDPPKDIVADYSARRKAAGKDVFLDGPHYELPSSSYPA